MTEAKWIAALVAIAHSLWVTGLAIVLALIVSAQAVGMISNPEVFFAFVRENWFTVTLVQVIAPLIRGSVAAAKA